jgi:hypothetical protein
MQKTLEEKNASRNLTESKGAKLEKVDKSRAVGLTSSRTVRKSVRPTKFLSVNYSASSASLSLLLKSIHILNYVYYTPIRGLKLIISSYNSSLSCSRLISSLCTVRKEQNMLHEEPVKDQANTYSRIRKTPDLVAGLPVHRPGHAGGRT